MHEATLHDQNCFITLTYNDDHLPSDGSLHYRHFQLFLKRLRRATKKKISFYMAGEYGDNFGRPHYHAIIFGYNFPDLKIHSTTPAGSRLYRSPLLERLWTLGYSSVGDVTFESAAYVARYVMKKKFGDEADKHYQTVDLSTGEITTKTPEFNRMSLKPAIGKEFYAKFGSDIHLHDHCIVRGVPTRPPRYYDKLLKAVDPDRFEIIREQRIVDALQKTADNTPQRLEARKKVTDAKISKLKRSLK